MADIVFHKVSISRPIYESITSINYDEQSASMSSEIGDV